MPPLPFIRRFCLSRNAMATPTPNAPALWSRPPKRCDRPGDDDRFRGVRSEPITNPNEPAWASLFWGARSAQRLTSVTPVMAAARTVIRAPIHTQTQRQSRVPP